MLKSCLLLAKKDVFLIMQAGQGFFQALLLGLLLIFVFSLAADTSVQMDPRPVAVIFWLATTFSLVLIFNSLYSLEEDNQARLGLLLAPVPVQAIWGGKLIAGLILLLLVQLLFIPAEIVFLGVREVVSAFRLFFFLFGVDWGLAVLGSLLGGLAQKGAGKEALLTIILFPLLIPLLLTGIKVGAALLGGQSAGCQDWLPIMIGFDVIYTGLALILFPFVYGE